MMAPWGRLGGGVSNLSSQVPATPPQAWPTLNKLSSKEGGMAAPPTGHAGSWTPPSRHSGSGLLSERVHMGGRERREEGWPPGSGAPATLWAGGSGLPRAEGIRQVGVSALQQLLGPLLQLRWPEPPPSSLMLPLNARKRSPRKREGAISKAEKDCTVPGTDSLSPHPGGRGAVQISG